MNNKEITEDFLREWDKHYSLVAHKSFVSGDEADIEIKNWLRQVLEQKEWREKIKSIVPEKADERNMAKVSGIWSLDTVGEVEAWNACRSEILNKIEKL